MSFRDLPPGATYGTPDQVGVDHLSEVVMPEYEGQNFHIGGVTHSFQDIVAGVFMMYDIDPQIVEQAGGHIAIPERQFIQGRDGSIYHQKSGMTRSGKAKPAKLVAYNIPEIPRNQQLALLLDVEIVTVYKRTSEGFTIEAGKVKHTRNLLLHCAADEMKRNFLLSKKGEASNLFRRVELAHKGGVVPPSLEQDSKSFYEEVMYTIRVSALDDVMLAALSWENDSNMPMYSAYPYCCRIWVLYNIFFRLLK